jgi:hypothetical protein
MLDYRHERKDLSFKYTDEHDEINCVDMKFNTEGSLILAQTAVNLTKGRLIPDINIKIDHFEDISYYEVWRCTNEIFNFDFQEDIIDIAKDLRCTTLNLDLCWKVCYNLFEKNKIDFVRYLKQVLILGILRENKFMKLNIKSLLHNVNIKPALNFFGINIESENDPNRVLENNSLSIIR